MEIVSNYGVYSPNYKSVTEVNRSQPTMPPAQPLTPHSEEKKPDYNWKTVAIVAGVSALALLGIAKRKSISNVAKKLLKKENEPYHNPNMRVVVNNSYSECIPEDEIRTSFEPEQLSEYIFKKERINQKRHPSVVHIDQNGNLIRQERSIFEGGNKQKGKKVNFNERCTYETINRGRKSDYGADDVMQDMTDTAVNFAIIDDILNGGKEVKSGFEHVKNIFSSGKNAASEMASADEVVGSGASSIGDFVSNIGERTSGFMDDVFKTASDLADSIGEGLGDFAESFSDVI